MRVALLADLALDDPGHSRHLPTIVEACDTAGYDPQVFAVADYQYAASGWTGPGLDGSAGVVLNRTDPRGVWAQEVSIALAKAGWHVWDPPPWHRDASDKYLGFRRFKAAGIPTIDTVVVGTNSQIPPFRFPVIVKARLSSGGRHVRLASNTEEYLAALKDVSEGVDDGVVVQPMVSGITAQDLRVHVVCGQPRLVIHRQAPAGSWQTNQSRGAVASLYDGPLYEEACRLATSAAAASNLWWAAIDLLISKEGRLLVCEANASPGVRGLADTFGQHVVDGLVGELLGESTAIWAAAQ